MPITLNQLSYRAIYKLIGAGLLSVAATAQAAVSFVNLGTSAPPSTLGAYSMQAFSTVPQAAIANGTSVTTLPGSPIPGSLTLDTALTKHTVPGGGWSTWSHGYTGPVYGMYTNGGPRILTLPPSTGAFYVYVEPNSFGSFNVQATTDTGASSGPISVSGSAGATGFGFHAGPGESIVSVTITADPGANGFAIGEFGIASSALPVPVPTLSEGGMAALVVMMLAGSMAAMRRRS